MIIGKEKLDEGKRAFLKKTLKLFFLFVALIFSILGLAILRPSNPKKKEYSYFEISKDKIPKEGVKKVDIKIENLQKPIKVYLVNNGHSIIALSPVCTHLGCFVNFDKNSNEFICSCHGGRFDIEGKVISGPPKDPLRRLPIKIEDNKILLGLQI